MSAKKIVGVALGFADEGLARAFLELMGADSSDVADDDVDALTAAFPTAEEVAS